MKISSHNNLRRRVSVDFSSPVITDPSWKKSSDINNIMAQYQKTGLLPSSQDKVAQYLDNTQVLPLEEAHARITAAKELFYELPAQIRKQMDNDPSQLDQFIQNPDNHPQLIQHGVLISRPPEKVEPSATPKADPPAAAPTE